MVRNKIAVVMLLVMLCLLLIACAPQKYMLNKDEAQQERAKQKAGLANPASVHCMDQTGTSWQVREGYGGQYGVCVFPDTSWCEEWAYYRGHCEPGMNLTRCEGQFWGKAVCPPDYNPVCGRIDPDGRWKNFNSACKACTGEENVIGYVIGKCE